MGDLNPNDKNRTVQRSRGQGGDVPDGVLSTLDEYDSLRYRSNSTGMNCEGMLSARCGSGSHLGKLDTPSSSTPKSSHNLRVQKRATIDFSAHGDDFQAPSKARCGRDSGLASPAAVEASLEDDQDDQAGLFISVPKSSSSFTTIGFISPRSEKRSTEGKESGSAGGSGEDDPQKILMPQAACPQQNQNLVERRCSVSGGRVVIEEVSTHPSRETKKSPQMVVRRRTSDASPRSLNAEDPTSNALSSATAQIMKAVEASGRKSVSPLLTSESVHVGSTTGESSSDKSEHHHKHHHKHTKKKKKPELVVRTKCDQSQPAKGHKRSISCQSHRSAQEKAAEKRALYEENMLLGERKSLVSIQGAPPLPQSPISPLPGSPAPASPRGTKDCAIPGSVSVPASTTTLKSPLTKSPPTSSPLATATTGPSTSAVSSSPQCSNESGIHRSSSDVLLFSSSNPSSPQTTTMRVGPLTPQIANRNIPPPGRCWARVSFDSDLKRSEEGAQDLPEAKTYSFDINSTVESVLLKLCRKEKIDTSQACVLELVVGSQHVLMNAQTKFKKLCLLYAPELRKLNLCLVTAANSEQVRMILPSFPVHASPDQSPVLRVSSPLSVSLASSSKSSSAASGSESGSTSGSGSGSGSSASSSVGSVNAVSTSPQASSPTSTASSDVPLTPPHPISACLTLMRSSEGNIRKPVTNSSVFSSQNNLLGKFGLSDLVLDTAAPSSPRIFFSPVSGEMIPSLAQHGNKEDYSDEEKEEGDEPRKLCETKKKTSLKYLLLTKTLSFEPRPLTKLAYRAVRDMIKRRSIVWIPTPKYHIPQHVDRDSLDAPVPCLIVRSPLMDQNMESHRSVVIWLHGKDENLADCEAQLRVFASKHAVDVIAIEYRGFGPHTTKDKSVTGIFRDLSLVVNHVLQLWDGSLYFYGCNVGGLLALHFILSVCSLENPDNTAMKLRIMLSGFVFEQVEQLSNNLIREIEKNAHNVKCPVFFDTLVSDDALLTKIEALSALFPNGKFFSAAKNDYSKPEDDSTIIDSIFANPRNSTPGTPRLLSPVMPSPVHSISPILLLSSSPKPVINEQNLAIMRHWLQNRGFDKMWIDYFESHNITSVVGFAHLSPEGPLAMKFKFVNQLIVYARKSCELLELPWPILKQRYRNAYHTHSYDTRRHCCAVPTKPPPGWKMNQTVSSSSSSSSSIVISKPRKLSGAENERVFFPMSAASRFAAKESTRQRSCSAVTPPPSEILSPPTYAEHVVLSPGRQRGDSVSSALSSNAYDDDPRRHNPIGVVRKLLRSGTLSGTNSPRCETIDDSEVDVVVPRVHSPPPSLKTSPIPDSTADK